MLLLIALPPRAGNLLQLLLKALFLQALLLLFSSPLLFQAMVLLFLLSFDPEALFANFLDLRYGIGLLVYRAHWGLRPRILEAAVFLMEASHPPQPMH